MVIVISVSYFICLSLRIHRRRAQLTGRIRAQLTGSIRTCLLRLLLGAIRVMDSEILVSCVTSGDAKYWAWHGGALVCDCNKVFFFAIYVKAHNRFLDVSDWVKGQEPWSACIKDKIAISRHLLPSAKGASFAVALVRHANSAYYSSMIMKYDPRVLGHALEKKNGDLKLDMTGKWALRLGLFI